MLKPLWKTTVVCSRSCFRWFIQIHHLEQGQSLNITRHPRAVQYSLHRQTCSLHIRGLRGFQCVLCSLQVLATINSPFLVPEAFTAEWLGCHIDANLEHAWKESSARSLVRVDTTYVNPSQVSLFSRLATCMSQVWKKRHKQPVPTSNFLVYTSFKS